MVRSSIKCYLAEKPPVREPEDADAAIRRLHERLDAYEQQERIRAKWGLAEAVLELSAG